MHGYDVVMYAARILQAGASGSTKALHDIEPVPAQKILQVNNIHQRRRHTGGISHSPFALSFSSQSTITVISCNPPPAPTHTKQDIKAPTVEPHIICKHQAQPASDKYTVQWNHAQNTHATGAGSDQRMNCCELQRAAQEQQP